MIAILSIMLNPKANLKLFSEVLFCFLFFLQLQKPLDLCVRYRVLTLHSKIFESSKLIDTAILMQHVNGLTGISSVICERTDLSFLGTTLTEQIPWKMSSNKTSLVCVYSHAILNCTPFFLSTISSNCISQKRTTWTLSSSSEQRKFPRKERISHCKQ